MHFDNYGNVDYTVILNSDMFCFLERSRLKTHFGKKRKGVKLAIDAIEGTDGGVGAEPAGPAEDLSKTDNRKVVVEDVIYIDDLEILIYTTVAPQTSQIFITSVKKSQGGAGAQKGKEEKVVTLDALSKVPAKALTEDDQSLAQALNPEGEKDDKKEAQGVQLNYYHLLAKLKGHKNSDAPSICYVPQSCCLISGEKHMDESSYRAPKGSFPEPSKPGVPNSHKFQQKSNTDSYARNADRVDKGGPICEVLIWNLQRDLIELFQSRPPWNMPYHRKIAAHNSSIVDICYLSKSQLLVTASTDQTIRFYDPVAVPYELTDAANNPHAAMRPGHYRPLQREETQANTTFREVKRIYCANDTTCYSIRPLHVQNVVVDPTQPQ